MNYSCLKQQDYLSGRYCFVPLRREDIYAIMEWRNAQLDILRQREPLTRKDQEAYFRETILPSYGEEHPKQVLFSILLDGHCIGYGGLVHIDWETKEGEMSFLTAPARPEGSMEFMADLNAFIDMIKQVAFKDLHFKAIVTETYDIRPAIVALLESRGFQFEKRLPNRTMVRGQPVDALLHRCSNQR